MSRRGLIGQQAAVSLFPFLAVLICTMGGLIVLLVVVVQQAKQSGFAAVTEVDSPLPSAADDPAAAIQTPETGNTTTSDPEPPPEPPQESAQDTDSEHTGTADEFARLREQWEDLEWRNSVLSESRQRTQWRLEEQRRNLGRHEDQSHALEAQLDLLEKQAQAILAAEDGDVPSGPQPDADSLAELQAQIAELTRQLDQLREEARAGSRRYSLVPYEGPQGTKRRPIYVECLADRVVLQPSGIELVADDFLENGPANPLAAALRATREYLRGAGVHNDAGEPYPLLIVRPGGAQTYSACRNALQGWGDEFGYELVADHIELAYPPSDAALTERLRQTIELARLELAARRKLLAISENPVAGLPIDALLQARDPSSSGGAVRDLGGIGAGDGLPAHLDPGSGPLGSRPPSRQGSDDQAGAANQGDARGPDFGRAPGSMDGTDDAAELGRGVAGGTSGDLATGPARPPGAWQPDSPRSSGDSGGSAAPDTVADSGGPERAGNGNGTGGQASAWGGNSGTGGGQGLTSSSGGAGAPAAAPQAPAGAGMSLTFDDGPQADDARSSLAKSQGDNWALPRAAVGSIGVTRPIRVTCGRDRIMLLPERGARQSPRTIPVGESVQSAVQPLVTAVWDTIEGWGIAGPGVYWKPVLQVHVEAAGEQTYTELSHLLRNSGLELQRR